MNILRTQICIGQFGRVSSAATKLVVLIWLITAGLGSVFAGDASADGKALQGSWVPTKAELGGNPMPEAVVKKIMLKIHNNDYEVTIEGEGKDSGTVSLDVDSNPKGMKITGVKGPNAGKTYPAIYELHGDTLRICYDLSGAQRPKEFKTVKGTQLYLVTYSRRKE
jgi:uncharacterized protein (TIGR03067 family)